VVDSFGRLDPWSDAWGLAASTAEAMAALLDRRAQGEDEATARATYLDLLAIRAGEQVVEVGCGHGIVLREIAPRVGSTGRVVGLDASLAFLGLARAHVAAAGLGEQMHLGVADARQLPLATASFDVALAVTTLAHIPAGDQAIGELLRVVRPGGRVGVFEQDTDSYVLSHPQRALTRRIVAAYTDYGYADGWLARRLPALLVAAGLQNVQVRAFAMGERDPEGFYLTRALRAADTARRAGAISASEHKEWVAAFEAERDAGHLWAGITALFVWGRR
jgi:ubiquinone/menaquinone biosynthesis C-methylase UbiE